MAYPSFDTAYCVHLQHANFQSNPLASLCTLGQTPISQQSTSKQYTVGNVSDLLVVPIHKGPDKVIEAGLLTRETTKQLQLLSIHLSGVQITAIAYLSNKLQNTVGQHILDIWQALHFQLGIEAFKNILNFDLLSGVSINEIETVPHSSISILMLEFSMSKTDPVVLMTIIFVQQGNAPVTVMCCISLMLLTSIPLWFNDKFPLGSHQGDQTPC